MQMVAAGRWLEAQLCSASQASGNFASDHVELLAVGQGWTFAVNETENEVNKDSRSSRLTYGGVRKHE